MLSEKESEYVEDFKSCNDMYKEPYLSARKARIRAEEERDKLKKEFQDLTDRYTQCCNAKMWAKVEEERDKLKRENERLSAALWKERKARLQGGEEQKDMYDMSDAVDVEIPSKNLKWQDVVLIGVFASTCISALAGIL